MKRYQLLIVSILFLFTSCNEEVSKLEFDVFLPEPCMILNYEQDNTIEGQYLIVEQLNIQDSSIVVKLPENFFINDSNVKNWVVAWGSEEPLYDAGVENIRLIKSLDISSQILRLGRLERGNGFPKLNQRIVFWNRTPSGFINQHKQSIIDPKIWPEFAGESLAFASVEYDSLLHKWVMITHECDTSKVQIYAATSSDLKHWEAANNGKPILKASDFESCKWTGRDISNTIDQAPYVSDILRFKGDWYLFMDGYSSDGHRHIGIAKSSNSLLGPYVIEPNPILSPGDKGTWNELSCFYAKVKPYKDGFIMFYDGRNNEGYERIGMAYSKDLKSWKNFENNPVIDQHTGWRSGIGSTEPNYIEIRKDSIILMIAGYKEFKMGAWHRHITKRMYLDKSGNVADAQLGLYLSTDGGQNFTAHKNNPIFTNDYSNLYENEHMGGNFKLIETDSADFIIYQAKSSFEGSKYNILLREKKKI